MATSHSSTPQESSGGFWSLVNTLIGLLLAGVALVWGVALVKGGYDTAVKIRAPKVVVAPVAPAAAAPVVAPSTTGAAPAAGGAVRELTLGPDATNPLLFNAKEFKVKAGSPIKLTFDNTGSAAPQPHNVVIGQVGSKDALTAASIKIMTDPAGMAKGYIPEDPVIIASIKLVQPGAKDSVTFTLPAPGDYPFMCMFPGHGILMNGVIHAE